MVQKILRTMEDDLKEAKEKMAGNKSEAKKASRAPQPQKPPVPAVAPQPATAPAAVDLSGSDAKNTNTKAAPIPQPAENSPAISNDLDKDTPAEIAERLEKKEIKGEEVRKEEEERIRRIKEEVEAQRTAKEGKEKDVDEKEIEKEAEEEKKEMEEKIRQEIEEKIRKEKEEQDRFEQIKMERYILEKERIEKEEAEKIHKEEERIIREKERQEIVEREREAKEILEKREAEKWREEEERIAREDRIRRERGRMEELRKREEELDELKRKEEEIITEEVRAREIEERRKKIEEEEVARIEELKKKEQEIKQAEEEEKRLEEEIKIKEEAEIKQTEEEAEKIAKEAKKAEEELEAREKELEKMEEEEKQKIAELKSKEDERIRIEEDLRKKEEELRFRQEEREKMEEMREQIKVQILEGRGKTEADEETGEETKNSKKEPEPKTEIKGKESEIKKNDPLTSAEDRDRELSDLINRISSSMSGSAKTTENTRQPAGEEVIKPDKDRELNDLISRISRNLEREKEILQKEKGQEKKEVQEESYNSANNKTPKSESISGKTAEENIESGNKEKNEPVDSYWTNLHDNLKHPDEQDPTLQAISEAKQEVPSVTAPTTVIAPPEKTDKKNDSAADSNTVEAGIITAPASVIETVKEEKPEKTAANESDEYVNPENRLIFGRQEYYSSLHKKVKPKTREENLETFKETVKGDEKHFSEEEEKKLLRHQIIKKYGIKLSTLPWAKIIIFTILFLGTIAASLYLILPRFAQKEPEPIVITQGQEIAEVSQKIPQAVSAKQDQAKTVNYFDAAIDPWKSYKDGDVVRLNINYNDHDVLLPRDEALKTILGEENFNNIPAKFKEFVSQEYSIIVFKNNDSIRLGIALEFDKSKEEEFRTLMLEWEKDVNAGTKMYSVMKRLFVSDRIVENETGTSFQPALHNGVELKYANIPDNNTSMDYFIYGNNIFFATSKDTTFEMIDLMKK